jgi:nucleotide-binding universal stress UspA family protein
MRISALLVGGTMFKKILVPLDGSPSATAALTMALKLAQAFQSQLILLHVGSLKTLLPLKRYERLQQITPEELTRFITITRDAGFTILEQGRQLVEAAGLPVKTIFKEGHPGLEIVRIARERGSDLIVLSAKGVSQIKELRLGSTSDQIVRNAPCTVMVYKTPESRSSKSRALARAREVQQS